MLGTNQIFFVRVRQTIKLFVTCGGCYALAGLLCALGGLRGRWIARLVDCVVGGLRDDKRHVARGGACSAQTTPRRGTLCS